jgi:hypothetical protein
MEWAPHSSRFFEGWEAGSSVLISHRAMRGYMVTPGFVTNKALFNKRLLTIRELHFSLT